MHRTPPPDSEQELLDNAATLSGKTLRQLASQFDMPVPVDQRRAKGWIGNLIEIALGATASSLSEPDFQNIGVELKTLPLNRNGRPKESTYVCTVPLTAQAEHWEDSNVKRKLSRVLWVPIEADPAIILPQRRIGNAFIWSPDRQQEDDLRTDWKELTDMIAVGELDQISSQFGKILQIRPKAANAKALMKNATQAGESGLTLPRGFYLRATFTYTLFKQHL